MEGKNIGGKCLRHECYKTIHGIHTVPRKRFAEKSFSGALIPLAYQLFSVLELQILDFYGVDTLAFFRKSDRIQRSLSKNLNSRFKKVESINAKVMRGAFQPF
jgi:hypothetical protein